MPTITLNDPLTAASDSVGAYSDQQRANEKTAHDRAAEQAAIDYQAKRDTRTDFVADRTYALTKATTDSELETAAQNRKIAQATEEYNAKIRPIELQAQVLDNAVKTGTIKADEQQRQLNAISIAHGKIEQGLYAKYGPQIAKTAMDQGVANLHRTQAETANTQENTARTAAEIPYIGAQMTGRGRAARAPSSIEQKEAALSARENLPPPLRSLLDQVESGQTTREMALIYVNGNPALKPYLPLMEQIVLTPTIVKNASQGQIANTDSQNALARGDVQDASPKDRLQAMQHAIANLPHTVQLPILAAYKGGRGLSISAIAERVQKSPNLSDDEKAQALQALSQLGPDGSSTPAAPAAAPQQGGGVDFMGMLGHAFQALQHAGQNAAPQQAGP